MPATQPHAHNHSAAVIAKYLIWKSKKSNLPITNKKLQKLLYYSQAWHLVFKNEVLFNEEIEAWVHGPAIRSVYNQYRSFGYNPINIEVSDQEAVDGLSEDELAVLDEVWNAYGGFDAEYLELLSHREEPWIIARNSIPEYQASTAIISTDVIKNYYARQITSEQNQEDSTEAGRAN